MATKNILYELKYEYTKGGPGRGESARAGKWTARAGSIQILQARAVAFRTGLRE